MAEKKDPDPFPHLPRRSFYEAKAEKIAALKRHISEQVEVLVVEPVRIDVEATAKSMIPTATTCYDSLRQPKKRGRPVADKPWEREGISRMTWYRRRKERGE